jgi:uncharacterized protein
MLILFISLFAGFVGGILMGIIGSGIGPIAISALIIILHILQVNNDLIMPIAMCTSLSLIIVNSFFATVLHYKDKNIVWSYYIKLLPGSLMGAMLGGYTLIILPSHILKYIFGIFLIAQGIHVLINRIKPYPIAVKINQRVWLKSALLAFLANIMGVGEGIFLVPYLHKFGLTLKQSVATSTALVIPVSLMGWGPLFIKGFMNESLPQFCWSYIYLPAFFFFLAGSLASALVGVRLLTSLPTLHIEKIFAYSLIMFGLKLLY